MQISSFLIHNSSFELTGPRGRSGPPRARSQASRHSAPQIPTTKRNLSDPPENYTHRNRVTQVAVGDFCVTCVTEPAVTAGVTLAAVLRSRVPHVPLQPQPIFSSRSPGIDSVTINHINHIVVGLLVDAQARGPGPCPCPSTSSRPPPRRWPFCTNHPLFRTTPTLSPTKFLPNQVAAKVCLCSNGVSLKSTQSGVVPILPQPPAIPGPLSEYPYAFSIRSSSFLIQDSSFWATPLSAYPYGYMVVPSTVRELPATVSRQLRHTSTYLLVQRQHKKLKKLWWFKIDLLDLSPESSLLVAGQQQAVGKATGADEAVGLQ